MPTVNCYPGETITLAAYDRGTDGHNYPSATFPTWTISDHTLAEFSYQSPDGHTVMVLAIATGTPTVIATLDSGTFTYTLNIVAAPTVTTTPTGDYIRNPPLEPTQL